MAAAARTVRFTRVVERCGEPHVHTLWVAPDKDPELKRALAAHRAMSVAPSGTGGATDVGTVGFDPAKPPAQLLIFPKSLKPFAGARIVGIKFDLVEQPELAPAKSNIHAVPPRPGKTALKKKPAAQSSAPPTDDAATLEAAPPAKTRRPAQAAPPPQRRRATPAAKSRAARPAPTPSPSTTTDDSPLLREVRAALQELEAGKVVAAHQRLARAAASNPSRRASRR